MQCAFALLTYHNFVLVNKYLFLHLFNLKYYFYGIIKVTLINKVKNQPPQPEQLRGWLLPLVT